MARRKCTARQSGPCHARSGRPSSPDCRLGELSQHVLNEIGRFPIVVVSICDSDEARSFVHRALDRILISVSFVVDRVLYGSVSIFGSTDIVLANVDLTSYTLQNAPIILQPVEFRDTVYQVMTYLWEISAMVRAPARRWSSRVRRRDAGRRPVRPSIRRARGHTAAVGRRPRHWRPARGP
jgi:hypothetical protein